ncbi:Conserved_hypothetical protein [Hexamita inflata]|uniref:Uncharacterized protein n=1 Tax=Hexamita inflata TaxID=28002 RepID=A0AA86PJZ4_9EUKA|nr:Conserved hypothetical protein [Hexamita inflata]
MSSCCQESAQIASSNNYYTCECIDLLKVLLDPLNPISSCVCSQNYFTFNSLCVECPADSFSSINSLVCTCSDQFQTHNVGTNECECVPKYSSKIKGTCTCINGAGINNELVCQCLNGFQMVFGAEVMCTCSENKYIFDGVCMQCPADAISAINANNCTCKQEYQIHNTETNQCQCQPTYSTKQNWICACPTGSMISATKCVCVNNFSMQHNPPACTCGLNHFIYNSQCIACPKDANSSSANSAECTCKQQNQHHDKESNSQPVQKTHILQQLTLVFVLVIMQTNITTKYQIHVFAHRYIQVSQQLLEFVLALMERQFKETHVFVSITSFLIQQNLIHVIVPQTQQIVENNVQELAESDNNITSLSYHIVISTYSLSYMNRAQTYLQSIRRFLIKCLTKTTYFSTYVYFNFLQIFNPV